MFDPLHCLTNITSEEKTNGYFRTGAPPLCMCMCTREGCGLGVRMLPDTIALLLEPEWPINVVSLLLSCGSHNTSSLITHRKQQKIIP